MPFTLAPIRTSRLELSPASRELAQSIVSGGEPAIPAGEGWPHDGTVRGFRMALERGHAPGWLVLLDGAAIGDCGIHGEPDESGNVEIGFGLAAAYHGRGYGTELVQGLSRWLLAQDQVDRVIARTTPENTPSRRALERAGFVLEGGGEELDRYVLSGSDRGSPASMY